MNGLDNQTGVIHDTRRRRSAFAKAFLGEPCRSRHGLLQLGVLLVCFAALLVGTTPASTTAEPVPGERRVALVVGNSNYRNVATLVNPSNDARLVARTLKQLGFSLVGGKAQDDLYKRDFDRLIESFGDQIRGADVALFYYAGHGVQVRGANYLVPIDANPTRESDVDFQLVDSETVLHQMEDANTRLNIIVLDACRNNPFGGRGLRAIGGGLAQMQAPEGTLISYATQPGNVASDGDQGDSPFTLALVHQVQQPGHDIFRVFNQVGLEVERATKKEQQPWVSNSPIDGDFYFAGSASELSVGVPATADPDVVFWQSIESSHNPADYQAYLKEFPKGHFVSLARSRAAAYRPIPAATASPSQAEAERQPERKQTRVSSAQLHPEQTPRVSLSTPSPAPASTAATQLALAEVPDMSARLGTATNGNYIVVGQSLQAADADLLVKRFQRFGYHPSVVPAELQGESRYSLRFGPYSPAEAEASRDDLARHWHDLTFHLLVNSKTGPLMDRGDAESAAGVVKQLGATATLVKQQVNGRELYQVEIGPFVTQKEAIRQGELLAEKYSDSLHCVWGGCDWQYTWVGAPPKLLCSNLHKRCNPDQ